MTLRARERETYEEAFEVPSYSDVSPGEGMVGLFVDLIRERKLPSYGASVLDAGCGSGKGTAALRASGFRVAACDLSLNGDPALVGPVYVSACLWDERDMGSVVYLANLHDVPTDGFFDYVFCCDVLEHIPTPLVMLCVRNMLAVARYGIFLSVSLVPDSFGAWVGKPLHQTVLPFTTWREMLGEIGTVIDARDLGYSGVFYVGVRR